MSAISEYRADGAELNRETGDMAEQYRNLNAAYQQMSVSFEKLRSLLENFSWFPESSTKDADSPKTVVPTSIFDAMCAEVDRLTKENEMLKSPRSITVSANLYEYAMNRANLAEAAMKTADARITAMRSSLEVIRRGKDHPENGPGAISRLAKPDWYAAMRWSCEHANRALITDKEIASVKT